MARIEKKDKYSYDELCSHKVSANALFRSVIDLMFEEIGEAGKGYDWALSHDMHDKGLPWYNLFIMTEQQNDEFKRKLIKVFSKQYGYGMKTRACENSVGMFLLNYGFSIDLHNGSDITMADVLRKRIREYEEKYGDLKYVDGFEKELKEKLGI